MILGTHSREKTTLTTLFDQKHPLYAINGWFMDGYYRQSGAPKKIPCFGYCTLGDELEGVLKDSRGEAIIRGTMNGELSFTHTYVIPVGERKTRNFTLRNEGNNWTALMERGVIHPATFTLEELAGTSRVLAETTALRTFRQLRQDLNALQTLHAEINSYYQQ